MSGRWLLPLHAAATWFMVGAVWFVQISHYPLLGQIPAPVFSAYERANIARTASVLGPAMLLELSCALALLLKRPASVRAGEARLGALLLGLIWGSTALLQVPAHLKLAQAPDAAVLSGLILSNWLRTAAWSARGALSLRMLSRGAGA